jgi:hypothetical protein
VIAVRPEATGMPSISSLPGIRKQKDDQSNAVFVKNVLE